MPDRPTLAEFLRARREQLTPADVGLPSAGRRRTPGLRREELAVLAGVSVDYVVRLEQGRDTHPSASVLGALADALRLSDDERVHLKRLAAITGGPDLCPQAGAAPPEVVPSVRALLDRLDPTPGFVIGAYFDLLAWNTSWGRLVAPLGLLDHPEPNIARFTFADPRARTAYLDWTDTADEQASALRSMSLHRGYEPGCAALVDELQQVPAFAERWSSHQVTEKRRGTKRLRHPLVGELSVAYEVLLLPDDGDLRLITWLPADEASDDALRRAVAEGATLRAV
ncbi:MAG TPA: helix-turn-helix transcriptional regulator [Acidimicrobiales bacterium]|jgi:transcriptional regulator with XRE-family HTH domain|nr:helix-turn-helix transcriptional regulator [Acidimicrobiales bacterium]